MDLKLSIIIELMSQPRYRKGKREKKTREKMKDLRCVSNFYCLVNL